MTKLSDTQAIILSAASQRDDGSLLPLPASIKPSGGTAKALAALLKRGFAEERETDAIEATYRGDGDLRHGLYLTPAGAIAIGIEEGEGDGAETPAPIDAANASPPPLPLLQPKAPSKAATVIDLLRRPDGATLPELIDATGWLPHTTRAALTGIRKKGHDVTRDKRDGVTRYRIVEAG